jgi:hypothetical protein
MPIFDVSRFVRLRYVQQITLNCHANSFAYAVYNANGPQTPFANASTGVTTTTAHQPKGWDQWAVFYNDYVVVKSKAHLSTSGLNDTSPQTGGGILSITVSDSNGAFGTGSDCLEDPKTKFKHMAPNTSTACTHLSATYDAAKFFHVKDVADNINRLGANTTSQPVEAAYFFLQYFTNDTTASFSFGPLCWLIIDYDVLYTSPKNIGQS